MSLDKIVVIIMALAFFGGLILLYRKGQKDQADRGRASSPGSSAKEEEAASGKSREKGRKTANS